MNVHPTDKQMEAIKELERAFAKCRKLKVYIVNDYGRLEAYNGNIVKNVDDKKSDFSSMYADYHEIEHGYNLDSWADDQHFIHLRGEE